MKGEGRDAWVKERRNFHLEGKISKFQKRVKGRSLPTKGISICWELTVWIPTPGVRGTEKGGIGAWDWECPEHILLLIP